MCSQDPQQRFVLEHGYHALHSAQEKRGSLMGRHTGVIVGVWSTESFFAIASPTTYGALNTLSVCAGRLSFCLGMHGTSLAVDAACAASLVACHLGVRALQSHECEQMLVAGVNILWSSLSVTGTVTAGMGSPRFRCHTFDARADGYVRAEACASAALGVDSFKCHPMIQGSAVRHDGRSASLTAPNGVAQQHLLRITLADAAVRNEDQISQMQAHGTGTSLGDPIEVGALASVISQRSDQSALHSVKANMGHAESGAGLVGLLSLATVMALGRCMPNAQLRILNPHLGSTLQGKQFVLASQVGSSPFAPSSGGVSSFGYQGTIAHAVLMSNTSQWYSAHKHHRHQVYFRRRFSMNASPYPFEVKMAAAVSDAKNTLFRLNAAGSLPSMVADHVVHGRIVFPGTGYLETVRAAWCAVASSCGRLREVLFLKALVIADTDTYIECAISTSTGHFEVRSTEDNEAVSVVPNCTGNVSELSPCGQTHNCVASRFSCQSAHALAVHQLYDDLDQCSLQYGPAFRRMKQAWVGEDLAISRVRPEVWRTGMLVYPNVLDAAGHAGVAITQPNVSTDARLPFALADAQLTGAPGELWAVRPSPRPPYVCTHMQSKPLAYTDRWGVCALVAGCA